MDSGEVHVVDLKTENRTTNNNLILHVDFIYRFILLGSPQADKFS